MDKSRFIVRAKITKSEQDKYGQQCSSSANKFVASLIVPPNQRNTEQHSSERPESTLSISGILGDNSEFHRGNSKDATIIRGLGKDTARQMALIDLAGANTGVKDRATRFAASGVIKLVGRPYLDIFH